MKVGRRQFIFGAAAAGSLAVSALGVRIWRESTVANIVRTRVPDARVSAADMELFEKEVMAHEHVLNRTLLVARGLPAPLRNLLPQAVRAQLDKVESRIAANFLMGTDYFHPDRKSETVSFIAYPDPYGSGCANPLARFDFPPAS
jgi:hypothetical protein